MMLDHADAQRLERCIAAGGVAVFPADTVYGLACDPQDTAAVKRLYALKGRSADKPAAVLFFTLDDALGALPELGRRTRAALEALLPGGLTVLLANPRGRLAQPATLGLRVPALAPAIAALHGVRRPLLQSSANRSGEPDARTLAEVDPALRAGADLVLDGGALPGTPSTVLDLRDYEDGGRWTVLREGAVARGALETALGGAS
jgi:L-threonylcarbamoyladenylate synthase